MGFALKSWLLTKQSVLGFLNKLMWQADRVGLFHAERKGKLFALLVVRTYSLYHYVRTKSINSAWQQFHRLISVYMANTEAYIYVQNTELAITEVKVE